jgi:hypothetical protein
MFGDVCCSGWHARRLERTQARARTHTHTHTHSHTHTHTHNVLPIKTIKDAAIIIVCVRVWACVKRSFHVKHDGSKACTSSVINFLSLPHAHICSDYCHIHRHSLEPVKRVCLHGDAVYSLKDLIIVTSRWRDSSTI